KIDTREPVLERDLLRAEMLLHRERVVRAALHRRVVRDDDALAARNAADAGHDAGARRLVVVAPPRRERRQLEESRAAVEEAVDAVAHEELAARGVARAGLGRTAGGGAGACLAQRPHQPLHVRGVLAKVRIGWPDAALEPHAAYQKYYRGAPSPRPTTGPRR